MPTQTLYKLTNEFDKTRRDTYWAEEVTHSVPTELRDANAELCSSHYLHAYENPYVAIFMNPVHASFHNPKLWEAKGEVIRRDGELKCGCFVLTTTRQLPLPVLSLAQRVKIAIYCAQLTSRSTEWQKWAAKWLTGEDRTSRSANAAATAATHDYAAATATEAASAAAAVTYATYAYAAAAATEAAYAAAAATAAAATADAAATAATATAAAATATAATYADAAVAATEAAYAAAAATAAAATADAAAASIAVLIAAAADAADADTFLISIINRVLAEGEV